LEVALEVGLEVALEAGLAGCRSRSREGMGKGTPPMTSPRTVSAQGGESARRAQDHSLPISLRFVTTRETSLYSSASAAVIQKSRSASWSILSIDRPVTSATMLL
jgi:hypothetical protein